jgi:hypothetical protein
MLINSIIFGLLVGVIYFFSSMFINHRFYENELNEEKYLKAKDDFLNGRAPEAIRAFKELGKYKDSAEKYKECSYLHAKEKFDTRDFDESIKFFAEIGDYKDAQYYVENIEKIMR